VGKLRGKEVGDLICSSYLRKERRGLRTGKKGKKKNHIEPRPGCVNSWIKKGREGTITNYKKRKKGKEGRTYQPSSNIHEKKKKRTREKE